MRLQPQAFSVLIPLALASGASLMFFSGQSVNTILIDGVAERGFLELSEITPRISAGMRSKDENKLLPALNEARQETQAAYLMAMDPSGVVLAHTNVLEKGKMYGDPITRRSLASAVRMYQLTESQGNKTLDVAVPIWADDEDFLLSHEIGGKVRIGTLRVGLPLEESFVTRARILKQILLILLATGGAMIAAILLFLRNLLRPIRTLAESTREIGLGKYGGTVSIPSKNEIGELAQSFNQMSRNLATTTVSKDYLDGVIRNMADILIVTDSGGAIRTINHAALLILGYSEAELLGQPISQLFRFRKEEDQDERCRFLKGAHLGGLTRVDSVTDIKMDLLTKTGKPVPVLLSGAVLKSGDGRSEGIIVVAHDLTERERAEAALRGSEERLSEVAENSRTFVWEVDAKGLYTYASRASEAVLGYRPDEITAKMHFYDLHPPAGREAFRTATFEVFTRRGIFHGLENPIQTKNGPLIWVSTTGTPILDADGALLGYRGSDVDVTERKQAAEAIHESYEMQGLLNAMLQHSLVDSPLQKKLADHLAELLATPWLGVEPKGAVFLMERGGKTLTMTAHHGLAPALLSSCAKVPMGRCLCGRAAQSGQIIASTSIGPDHETVYAGMLPHGHYCAPIMAGGRPLGVLCLYLREGSALTAKQEDFIKAVTDILAANIVHARVEEQLGQSQKMESIGRLAGGVAHDFNNLLTAINGYAHFVMDGLPKDDPKREDVQEILAAGGRAAALTKQLLAFSRRQILNPETLDLNAAVGGAVNMLTRLIGEDIKLEPRLAALPCPVKADAGQISQVLMNLAINARDAMPNGGSLTISTETVSMPEEFFRDKTGLQPGPLVLLRVADTGTGIDDEGLRHVFEPFFTTKEKGKGTGLGLSTVYGIVKQSGAEIVVESAPGQGAVFSIYFPRVAASAERSPGPEATRPLTGRETVLLAEDEETVRRLIQKVLLGLGYTVLAASDGASALKALKDRGERVDLLLTDVVMPGMNGRELAKQVAKQYPDTRTIFMSGYTDDAIVRHGVLEPGLAFIYKPFVTEALALKVRVVLDGPSDQAKA